MKRFDPWISVNEKLPLDGRTVVVRVWEIIKSDWVYFEDRYHKNPGTWENAMDDTVSHWTESAVEESICPTCGGVVNE